MFNPQKNTLYIFAAFIFNLLIIQKIFPSFVSEKIHLDTANIKDLNGQIKKDWTLLIYMVANKNLSHQAIKNIKQMTRVGSTSSINVIVQLDKENEQNIERFYIQKNSVLLVESIPQTPENIGGTPKSLYNFLSWGITTFPSNKIALILWNFGTGIKEYNFSGKFLINHKDSYFTINPQTKLYDLNNQLSTNFNLLKKIEAKYNKKISLDTTQTTSTQIESNKEFISQISNQALKDTLEQINQEFLNNKKINLICIDSCFMAMIEIASQLKNSVKYLVASQNIEPQFGYNYETILTPFLKGTIQPDAFAKNIADSFKKEYSSTYSQYTQSVINLESTENFEQNFKIITDSLLKLILSNPTSLIGTIKYLRTNQKCTKEFFDSDYIDLTHFLKNLINAINTIKKPKRNFTQTDEYIKNLDNTKKIAQELLDSMSRFIMKNVISKYSTNSNGISIYFPTKKIDKTYYSTDFDIKTNWSLFLNAYLKSAKQTQEIKIEDPKKEDCAKISDNKSKQITKSIQTDNKNKPNNKKQANEKKQCNSNNSNKFKSKNNDKKTSSTKNKPQK